MPNHITNILRVRGTEEDVLAFVRKARGPDGEGKERVFTCHAFVPQPEGIFRGNLTDEDRRANPVNWLDWNNKNWGTKWGAYDAGEWETRQEGGQVTAHVKFTTAWAPPVPVLEAAAAQHPTLRVEHEFICEGWNFCGAHTYEAGVKVEAESRDATYELADRPYMHKMYKRCHGSNPPGDEYQDESGDWQVREVPVADSVLSEAPWTNPAGWGCTSAPVSS